MRPFDLDETGLSPPPPAGGSCRLPNQRTRVRSESPPGRRVNAVATDDPSARAVGAVPLDRTLTSDDLPAHLRDR